MTEAPQATTAEPVEAIDEAPSLIDSIVQDTGMARRAEDVDSSRHLIELWAEEALEGTLQRSANQEAALKARIAELDELISAQLNEVIHHPDFQAMEATWRGLQYLVFNTETSGSLKIKVLNATKKDMLKDFEKAPEFDQSSLFKLIHEREFGMPGGEPYGVLIGDYQFGIHPQDVSLLGKMSEVAAAAHAPFISAAGPDMFDLDAFTDINNPRDLAQIFTRPEYIPYRSFRDTEDSRYVTLVLPRYLSRLPYGRDTVPVEDFNFEEGVDGREHKAYLWGNAAYVYGTRITDAFAQYGWCVAIRGMENGGMVGDLPLHTFTTDDGETAIKCPTEVEVPERRENELSDLGFISLCAYKNTDYAVFFGGQTTNNPKKYVDDDATANARLSARLPYIMAVSRIAHFLKAIVRDKVGAFATKDEIQKHLQTWINQYVLLDTNAPDKEKAKRPLAGARIMVEEIPGQPGAYQARAWLKPIFQLESIDISLRLVAKLPS